MFCRAWSGSKGQALSGSKLFAKVISRWQKLPLVGERFKHSKWSINIEVSLKRTAVNSTRPCFFFLFFVFSGNLIFFIRKQVVRHNSVQTQMSEWNQKYHLWWQVWLQIVKSKKKKKKKKKQRREKVCENVCLPCGSNPRPTYRLIVRK